VGEDITQANEQGASRYAVRAAVRVLNVLFAFQGADGPLAVSDVATRLAMTRNQVYRSMKTLETVGLVRDGPGGFTLTPRLLDLVPAMEEQSVLAVAEPLCMRLRDQTGETVNLVVPAGRDETVLIATYPTRHSVGLLSRVGDRSYMHAGAVPKAILAFRQPEEIERFLALMPDLPRYTPRTRLDAEALRHELSEIRVRGFSITDEDY
jgi:DNA-binding IclR family transcriptional regulator